VFTIDLSKSQLDIPVYRKIDIEQYYLKHTDDCERRVRIRKENGKSTYYYTVQKKESKELSKIIKDKKITVKEFLRLINTCEIVFF